MVEVGKDPQLKRFYRRKLVHKGMGKARIAAAANWASGQAFLSIRTKETSTTAPSIATKMLGMSPPFV